MKLFSVTLLSLLVCANSYADTAPSSTINTLPITFRTDYQIINMPTGEKNFGLLGLHGLVHFNSWIYGGVGLYGATNGNENGFFALGLEGGVNHQIIGHWYGDAGIFVGAGGGHNLSASIGDGRFWEPHIGIQYQWTHFRTGISFSHLKFTQGNISSNQAMFTIDVPFDLTISSERQNQALAALMAPNQMPSLLFTQNYVSVVGSTLLPKKGTLNNSGEVDDHWIGLTGVEAGHYFTQNSFGYLNFQGAAHGHDNGFASLVGGYGYRFNAFNSPDANLVGLLGAGSAGGGGINTGGGFVVNPQIGLQYLAWRPVGIELDGGYLWAPSSHYRAFTSQLQIQYYFDTASIDPTGALGQPLSAPVYLQGWRIRLGDQAYLNPQRNDDSNANIQLFSAKADYFINDLWYLSGQTAFAYTGDAAGYFSGLIGPGFQTPAFVGDWLHAYAELLGGAAGGAGLSLGEGAIIEPLVGLSADITPNIGVYASVGRTIAPGHSMNTTTLDAGFSYRFSTLTH